MGDLKALSGSVHVDMALSRRPAVASACLAAERLRGRRLEELLASWHVAVWGPGAETLVRDGARLAMVRGLHIRAGALVGQAWRELSQLSADVLSDGGALIGVEASVAEDFAAAANRYKEMLQQLQANL